MKILKILPFLLLFPIIVFSSDYTISKFIKGKVIPPANTIIFHSSKLVTSTKLSFGEILLRRKFGANDHGLFCCKLKTNVSSKLSRFAYPKGYNLKSMIKVKFYSNLSKAKSRSVFDLVNIYFDKDFIYVDNRSSLIYHNGRRFITLYSIQKNKFNKDAKAFITSIGITPRANVYIDDEFYGATPIKSLVIKAGSRKLKFIPESKYYYQKDTLVLFKAGYSRDFNIKLKKNYGKLIVKTKAVIADLYLNNNFIGTTPIKKDSIHTGVYSLILKNKFYKSDTIEVNIPDNGKSKYVNLKLKPDYGKIIFNVKPYNAKIFINDKLIINNMESFVHKNKTGTYIVRIDAGEKYLPYTESVKISLHSKTKINISLVHKKNISSINSTPTGANVYLDNKYMGKTPWVSDSLLTGDNYNLQLKLKGYFDNNINLNVNDGEISKKYIKMIKSSVINITSIPTDEAVYLDGIYVGSTPIKLVKPPGWYTIRIKKELYREYKKTIHFNGNEYNLHCEMISDSLYKRSINNFAFTYFTLLGSFWSSFQVNQSYNILSDSSFSFLLVDILDFGYEIPLFLNLRLFAESDITLNFPDRMWNLDYASNSYSYNDSSITAELYGISSALGFRYYKKVMDEKYYSFSLGYGYEYLTGLDYSTERSNNLYWDYVGQYLIFGIGNNYFYTKENQDGIIAPHLKFIRSYIKLNLPNATITLKPATPFKNYSGIGGHFELGIRIGGGW